jgi:hypothetical protein
MLWVEIYALLVVLTLVAVAVFDLAGRDGLEANSKHQPQLLLLPAPGTQVLRKQSNY